jgi:gamma-glutamylcyclotransferase (GGCT)/AIG2-like uncharacterized protein YtfP
VSHKAKCGPMGLAAGFDESKHPRRGDGRFVGKPTLPKPSPAAADLRSAAEHRARPVVDRDADLTLRRPVFVYGTLLAGFHNACLLPSSVSRVPATVSGVGMWAGPGFPYCAEDPDGVVVGELVDIPVALWDMTVSRLDHLEGFYAQRHPHNLYDRVVAAAALPDGTTAECYMYVAARRVAAEFDDADRIAGGDWRAHCWMDSRAQPG